MKAISLFAGVGGFDLALTSNGAEVVFGALALIGILER